MESVPELEVINELAGKKGKVANISIRDNPSYPRWEEMRREEEGKISASINEDVASAISADKYGFVQGALRETMSGGEERHKDNTKLIDAVVTSKLFGFPLFIAAMCRVCLGF